MPGEDRVAPPISSRSALFVAGAYAGPPYGRGAARAGAAAASASTATAPWSAFEIVMCRDLMVRVIPTPRPRRSSEPKTSHRGGRRQGDTQPNSRVPGVIPLAGVGCSYGRAPVRNSEGADAIDEVALEPRRAIGRHGAARRAVALGAVAIRAEALRVGHAGAGGVLVG